MLRCGRGGAAIGISIDNDVQSWGAGSTGSGSVLPNIPDEPTYHKPLPDLVGDTVRNDHVGLLVGAGGFAVHGALTGSGSMLSRLGRGSVRGAAALAGLAALDVAARGITNRVQSHKNSQARDNAAVAATSIPASADGEHLRVMTFNVHDMLGPEAAPHSTNASWDEVEATIRRQKPDIVMLQEVSDWSPATGFDHAPDRLVSDLQPTSMAYVPGATRAVGGSKGTAIMTFGDHHIEDSRGIRIGDLEGDSVLRRTLSVYGTLREHFQDTASIADAPAIVKPYHPRSATDVLVHTPGGADVRVVAAHMSGLGAGSGGDPDSSRPEQVLPMARALGAWRGPTIYGADFNIKSTDPQGATEATDLKAAGLDDAFTRMGMKLDDPRRGSFPTSKSVRPIDRIYVSDQLHVDDARVATDEHSSDHHPVVVDVTL